MLTFLSEPREFSLLFVLAAFCCGAVAGYVFARWEHQYWLWESWAAWAQSLLQAWYGYPVQNMNSAPQLWSALPVSALLGFVASRRRQALLVH